MKKTGLALAYNKINYGTVLQAYATQDILSKSGYENEVICMKGIDKSLNKRKARYFLKHALQRDLIKAKKGMLLKKILEKVYMNTFGHNMEIRENRFHEFIRDKFMFSPAFATLSDLSDYCKDTYSSIVVGSDQLWLPAHIEADFYTLNWAPETIKKISYATSFGVSEYPKDMISKVEIFLSRFNNISVREEQGKKIVWKYTAKDVPVVCDPTMLLSSEQWLQLASKKNPVNEKYIFCYFLGNARWNREFALEIKKLTGFKVVALLHMDEYIKDDERYADYTPYDVGPTEFLRLIEDAEYICTDSFHGAVFSILFHKQFFLSRRFKDSNKMSTNSRVDTLLNQFQLQERLITQDTSADKIIKQNIDYAKVDEILNGVRSDALVYLSDCLEISKPLSNVCEKNEFDCCGCSACMNVCPKQCLEMKADREGFSYPVMNNNDCISCGACLRVCPENNYKKNYESLQKAYLVQNKDNIVRQRSTSGGFFGVIADAIVKNGGVVYGAAFDDALSVEHIGVSANRDLCRLNSSKYVQSKIEHQYKEIQYMLKQGQLVCFSGTPCQIEGLRRFLKCDYTNLLLVDVVCRGVPSPKIWDNYLRLEEKRLKQHIINASFRDKSKYGYRYTQMRLTTEDRDIIRGGIDWNPYLRSFFSNSNVRPSCFKCRFRSHYRFSDITMWDCLDIREFNQELDTKGTTRVLIHSMKGNRFFNNVKSCLNYVPIDSRIAIKNVKEMQENKIINANRKLLFEGMGTLQSFEKTCKRLYPRTVGVCIEHVVRILAVRSGLYAGIKKISKKWR